MPNICENQLSFLFRKLRIMQWLQLCFDFTSTTVRLLRQKVNKVTVT